MAAPISLTKGFARGLRVLEALILNGGGTVAEIAARVDLPEATTYRLLESLKESGFAFRSKNRRRYRSTAKVQKLAKKAAPLEVLLFLAEMSLERLAAQFGWPVMICGWNGHGMEVLQIARTPTPRGVSKLKEGWEFVADRSAGGLAVVVFSGAEVRDQVAQALRKHYGAKYRLPEYFLPTSVAFREAKRHNYTVGRNEAMFREHSVAVPLRVNGQTVAALEMRCRINVVSVENLKQHFAMTLLAEARRIEDALARHYST